MLLQQFPSTLRQEPESEEDLLVELGQETFHLMYRLQNKTAHFSELQPVRKHPSADMQ